MKFSSTYPKPGPAALRREISFRNLARSTGVECELTYGAVPSVIYQGTGGRHGNFHPLSYRSICADSQWCKRLAKSYSGGKWIPRSEERKRRELDCANSSDALLMNVFCYPRLFLRSDVCSLLGIDAGLRPEFGFKARLPLCNGRTDRTEIDMSVGHLLVEAKLTETGFQRAPVDLLLKYRDVREVFDIDDLPISESMIHSYQLIRGVLAASFWNRSFLVLCDGRRSDLQEHCFRIMRAVRDCRLRSQIALLTWQELAGVLPRALRLFVEEKYGILPVVTRGRRL